MCGIAGILRFNSKPVENREIKRMTDVISYRGPDGEGQWINAGKNMGFGHRRLSIIDLSENGKQPMHYAEGRYTITFNGEIYNYIELREMLSTKGYRFFSGSDTEVLMALYDLKKEKSLDDLDGMFSFAIWDEKEQTLFCARDRFGEKPFHYYSDGNEFIFGSEIKQFWSYGIEKKVTDARMKDFLLNGNADDDVDANATFYTGIKKLDAACYMIITGKGEQQIKRYWKIDEQADVFKGNMKEASSRFFDLLSESIRLRLRSDVPVGSSLSGGLDSSSIVMLIDRMKDSDQKQNTFSARFRDFSKDEGHHIEEVVKNCKHVEVNYTWPDEAYFSDVFDRVNYHQDEPYGSASIVAQYAVMQLAKEHGVTVLLDGQGADEYLAGYPPYYGIYLNQLFYNNRKRYISELESYNSLHEHKYPSLVEKETWRMKMGRYKRKAFQQKMPVNDQALKKQLAIDTTCSGLKSLLRYADRNSMAHSREVRLPFLSHKLVEFAFTLPDSYKLHEGWTKYVLRDAMNSVLPKSICWRSDKIGYEPPQDRWLSSGRIKDDIQKAKANFKSLDVASSENDAGYNWRLLMLSKYA